MQQTMPGRFGIGESARKGLCFGLLRRSIADDRIVLNDESRAGGECRRAGGQKLARHGRGKLVYCRTGRDPLNVVPGKHRVGVVLARSL